MPELYSLVAFYTGRGGGQTELTAREFLKPRESPPRCKERVINGKKAACKLMPAFAPKRSPLNNNGFGFRANTHVSPSPTLCINTVFAKRGIFEKIPPKMGGHPFETGERDGETVKSI